MSGPRKSGFKTDFSDVLRLCVERAPRDIWKTLTRHTIANRSPGVRKGTTMGKLMDKLINHEEFGDVGLVSVKKTSGRQTWCSALTSISAIVEDIMFEGLELTPNGEHVATWTVDTIDAVLFNHIDEDIGWRLPPNQLRIAHKKVEITQDDLCARCSKKEQLQLDHLIETPVIGVFLSCRVSALSVMGR